MTTKAPKDYKDIHSFIGDHMSRHYNHDAAESGRLVSFILNLKWLMEHFELTRDQVVEVWAEFKDKYLVAKVEDIVDPTEQK